MSFVCLLQNIHIVGDMAARILQSRIKRASNLATHSGPIFVPAQLYAPATSKTHAAVRCCMHTHAPLRACLSVSQALANAATTA